MSSTSEVGHAKNVANMATLITYCTSYGTNYNPSNNTIKITALNTLETSAQAQLISVINYSTASINAINARLAAFQNIKKLATRMLSALIASGASKQQIANAKTINRKIQGNRGKITPPSAAPATSANTSNQKTTTPPGITPVVTPATPVTLPHTISTSQRSYDNLIQHITAFIALLQSIPNYNPNETDLKITSLNTYLNTLTSTNNAAVAAQVAANNARIARNKILYAPLTGLCDIAEEAKEYVRSVYGSTSPEYKQVRAVKFKKQKI